MQYLTYVIMRSPARDLRPVVLFNSCLLDSGHEVIRGMLTLVIHNFPPTFSKGRPFDSMKLSLSLPTAFYCRVTPTMRASSIVFLS